MDLITRKEGMQGLKRYLEENFPTMAYTMERDNIIKFIINNKKFSVINGEGAYCNDLTFEIMLSDRKTVVGHNLPFEIRNLIMGEL